MNKVAVMALDAEDGTTIMVVVTPVSEYANKNGRHVGNIIVDTFIHVKGAEFLSANETRLIVRARNALRTARIKADE
jgi:hypothetical protein